MSRAESFPAMPDATIGDWIGRVEERDGALTPELAGMLSAALGHGQASAVDVRPGAPMPPLWHWVAFPEFVPLAELGEDGHPALGRFLPPLDFRRRMWAGGRLEFAGTFRIGEKVHRRSEIVGIDRKDGGTGSMVFVRVAHDVTAAAGSIREEQDIVYLDIPDTFRPPKAIPVPQAVDFDERVPVNEARLFRFSAATFNAHRIHYDLAYARDVERYPALVVHGPMQAMMLMEAACRHTGKAPSRFRFRGVHPMFHDEDMRLLGAVEPGETAIDLCTGTPTGHQCLQARMEWRP